jgi:hypothetical protein
MSWMRALRFALLGLALAYAFPAACGSGGVVGGKCKSGFPTNCDGRCVNLESDVDNCGTCGNVCPADEGCGDGVCDPDVPRPQGGASNRGGTSGDAGSGASSNEQGGSGELPDGGFFDAPVDGQGDAEEPDADVPDADVPVECLPPHDSPSHCGDCDTQCPTSAPLCQPDGSGGFKCVPKCDSPLVECNGECVAAPAAYLSDPDNCGECGNECPSDICQNGKCVGARYGNIALLCMDLNSATTDSAPSDLLGNAVFVPALNPVNVLAYTRGATPAAVSKVHNLIKAEGATRGRDVVITEASAVATVISDLNTSDYQVLLVHDLDQAAAGSAAGTGTEWESGSTISSFTKAGGVVVVLDGSDGRGEMHELIISANLLVDSGLTLSGQTEITGDGVSNMAPTVFNMAPADVLGANVLDNFLATSHACTFDVSGTPSKSTIFVITDDMTEDMGEPVVIHRVIAP